MSNPLQPLARVSDADGHAADLLTALDRCFLLGFGRLGPDQARALETVGKFFGGTGLGPALAESLEALGRLEFIDQHFLRLACARSALQGARYDAFRAAVAEALGRTVAQELPSSSSPEETTPEGPIAGWCESTRQWLMELAVAGFKNLEQSSVGPFNATLEQLQADPRLVRLASLLTGFHRELLHALPMASLPVLPIYRWADLWSRGMVGTLAPLARHAGRPVSGRLSPFGVDLRQHGHFASADVYALLEEPEAPPRVVRTSVSGYKVDAVRGDEVWNCFAPEAQSLLRATSDRRSLELEEFRLLESGELVWDKSAKSGPAYEPMTLAAQWLAPGAKVVSPGVSAADRHPVQLAEPVFLEGYSVGEDDGLNLTWGESFRLPVATGRPLPNSGATIDVEARSVAVRGSQAMIGLLRFDSGRWSVQPLGVRTKGKSGGDYFLGPPEPAKGSSKKKKDGDTLAILRERAGRLLRKKS